VKVTVAGVTSIAMNHPLQVPAGQQRDLDVGEAVIITSAAEVGCNEIASADGAARYILAAYNVGTSATSSTGIQISGDTTVDESPTLPARRDAALLAGPQLGAAADVILEADGDQVQVESHEDEDAHLDLLRRDRKQY